MSYIQTSETIEQTLETDAGKFIQDVEDILSLPISKFLDELAERIHASERIDHIYFNNIPESEALMFGTFKDNSFMILLKFPDRMNLAGGMKAGLKPIEYNEIPALLDAVIPSIMEIKDAPYSPTFH